MARPHYTRDAWGEALRSLLEPAVGPRATSAQQRYWMLLGAAAEAAGFACAISGDGSLALFQPGAGGEKAIRGDLTVWVAQPVVAATIPVSPATSGSPPRPQRTGVRVVPKADQRQARSPPPAESHAEALAQPRSDFFGDMLADLAS